MAAKLLADAARGGNVGKIREWLAKWGNSSELNEAGPALMAAAETGHVDILRDLLTAGVGEDGAGCRDIALKRAIMGGHAEVVRLLLESGTAMHMGAVVAASRADHPEVVRLLVRRGAYCGDLTKQWCGANVKDGVVRVMLEEGLRPPPTDIPVLLQRDAIKDDSALAALLTAPAKRMRNGTPLRMPMPNPLPPEVLEVIFRNVFPNPRDLPSNERLAERMNACRTFRQCALTCKEWTSAALPFLWRDLIADHTTLTIRPLSETQQSRPVAAEGQKWWDPRRVRRVRNDLGNDGSPTQLCGALRIFGNLRVLKLEGCWVGARDLANVFDGCPKVECLSVQMRGTHDQSEWTTEPFKETLVAGLEKLRIISIGHASSSNQECRRHTRAQPFVDFIVSKLSTKLEALKYLPPAECNDNFAWPFESWLQSPITDYPSSLKSFEYYQQSMPHQMLAEDPVPRRLLTIFPGLTTLIFHRRDITRTVAKTICDSCPQLQTLRLHDVKITVEAINHLAKGPKLSTFQLYLASDGRTFDPSIWKNLVDQRAPYWVNLQLGRISLPLDAWYHMAEKAQDTMRTIRLEECSGLDDVGTNWVFVSLFGYLTRFTNDWVQGEELREKLRGMGIEDCGVDDGREEVDVLEEEICWAP
ncbi:hypothetical protein HDV00_003697 [Rhizophlyctis rosea]|nr:hypothetical protein HDV00_003697 [Rhizophlyctis rosea]